MAGNSVLDSRILSSFSMSPTSLDSRPCEELDVETFGAMNNHEERRSRNKKDREERENSRISKTNAAVGSSLVMSL